MLHRQRAIGAIISLGRESDDCGPILRQLSWSPLLRRRLARLAAKKATLLPGVQSTITIADLPATNALGWEGTVPIICVRIKPELPDPNIVRLTRWWRDLVSGKTPYIVLAIEGPGGNLTIANNAR